MTTTASAGPSSPPPTLDGLAGVELLGVFLLAGALLGVSTLELVHDNRDPVGYTKSTLTISIALGAGLGLAAALGTIWAWHRTGGRSAQRLGRRAWRTGQLPTSEPARERAIADLHRREKTLTRTGAGPSVLLAVIWSIAAALRISDAQFTLAAVGWGASAIFLIVQATRTVLDMRRLPELQTLLQDHQQTAPEPS